MVVRRPWAITAGLIVAFAAGWFGAEIRNINKIPLAQVYASEWNASVMTLVQNGRSSKLIDPAKMPAIIGASLDNLSIQLAITYDDLSPFWKRQVIFNLPAARAIVNAGGESFPDYRGHLGIFIDCVQQVQAHGGSVRNCALGNKRWKVGGFRVVQSAASAVSVASSADPKQL